LTDESGPLDTTIDMTFTIYDQSTGGAVFWTETQDTVIVISGLFYVVLGSVNSIPDTVFADTARWLGIKVGDDSEIHPRTILVSVAYAFRVATVDRASGGVILGDVDIQSDLTVSGKATIGPDHSNTGSYAFVAGENNTVDNWGSTVGGGSDNVASEMYSAVSGGANNQANGEYSSVGGGAVNIAGGQYSTVGGGESNTASGDYAAIGGGGPNGEYGYEANTADGPYSVIGGGSQNLTSDEWATIGGGADNTASGMLATVSGGEGNAAGGNYAWVGGGYWNTASGSSAAVGGGNNNTASGERATVPGGYRSAARGDYSLAAGNRAKANHDGSVVIAANSSTSYSDSVRSGGPEQMVLRADGGIYITNTAEEAPYDTNLITTRGGAYLSGDGTNWTNASDKSQKENFFPVSGEQILEKVAALPITRWNYKSDDDHITHIGPNAQDFYAIFGVGKDDKSISTIDPAGIALAAIQELYITQQELRQKTEKIDALKTQLKETNVKLSELSAAVKMILAMQNDSRSGDSRLAINP